MTISKSKTDRRTAAGAAAMAGTRWSYGDIWEAYGQPSAAKVAAWRRCEQMEQEAGGWGLCITSRNSFRFSAVFFFRGEAGELCACYITPDKVRVADLGEDFARTA